LTSLSAVLKEEKGEAIFLSEKRGVAASGQGKKGGSGLKDRNGGREGF